MDTILNTTILGLIFGTLGTTLGGILGAIVKTKSNKFLSFILEFAAGLMVAIVCFELIPEAMEVSNMLTVIIGIIIGVPIMIFCDNLVNYKYSNKNVLKMNSLIKTGIIVGIGLAIHNFPEGLAIGSGFSASTKLGITLAVAIALHDVPEGSGQSSQFWLSFFLSKVGRESLFDLYKTSQEYNLKGFSNHY